MIYVIQNRQRFVEFLSARSLEFIFFQSDIVASTRELQEVNVLRNHNYDHVITMIMTTLNFGWGCTERSDSLRFPFKYSLKVW